MLCQCALCFPSLSLSSIGLLDCFYTSLDMSCHAFPKKQSNSPILEREGGKTKGTLVKHQLRREEVWSEVTDLARCGDERRCGESVTVRVPLREGISS